MSANDRNATPGEVAVCESHRRRGLYLRREAAEAVPGLEELEVTITFLHPGWAVADWYGGLINDCRVFETQAEAEAALESAVEYDLADRIGGERLPEETAVRCDCGCYPRQLAGGHHPDCAVYVTA